MQRFLPEPTSVPISPLSESIKQRLIELEISGGKKSVNWIAVLSQNFNLSLFLLPQWEMTMISWVWANSRKPSPPTLRSPYLTSCSNLKKATLSRINPSISTAKRRLPRRFTSSATVSGSIRKTTLWKRGWMKTQVSTVTYTHTTHTHRSNQKCTWSAIESGRIRSCCEKRRKGHWMKTALQTGYSVQELSNFV